MFRKDKFPGKDDETIMEWGEELHLEECTRPELTQV